MSRVSADTAKELALRLAICPFDMPTSRAALAGVFRVYQDDRNTGQPRLVVDELPQLGKTPIAVPRSFVFASNPCPRADMRQIFQRNSSVRAFGSLNESLADRVVNVFLETALATCQLFQVAFGRLCAALLKLSAEALVLPAIALNRRASVDVAVAGSGDIRHAQIDSQCSVNITLIRIGNITHCQQVEHAFTIYEVGFALPVCQQLKLTLARLIGNVQPSANAPNADTLVVGLPRQNAVVIGNRAVRLEAVLCPLIKRIGVRNLGNTANDHLRRQSAAFPCRVVTGGLQIETAKLFQLPRLFTEPVAKGVGLFQRLQKVRPLFVVGQQFDLRDEFHT